MKINHIGAAGVNPYQKQLKNLEKQASQVAKASDKVEISSKAQEMQSASKIVTDRKEKVEALKIQVQNGQYSVDPKTIAADVFKFYSK